MHRTSTISDLVPTNAPKKFGTRSPRESAPSMDRTNLSKIYLEILPIQSSPPPFAFAFAFALTLSTPSPSNPPPPLPFLRRLSTEVHHESDQSIDEQKKDQYVDPKGKSRDDVPDPFARGGRRWQRWRNGALEPNQHDTASTVSSSRSRGILAASTASSMRTPVDQRGRPPRFIFSLSHATASTRAPHPTGASTPPPPISPRFTRQFRLPKAFAFGNPPNLSLTLKAR